MKAPLVKFLAWSTCSVAVATALVAIAGVANPSTAYARVLVVPEPAVLLLLVPAAGCRFTFPAVAHAPHNSSRQP